MTLINNPSSAASCRLAGMLLAVAAVAGSLFSVTDA